jgi:hypothetical protein
MCRCVACNIILDVSTFEDTDNMCRTCIRLSYDGYVFDDSGRFQGFEPPMSMSDPIGSEYNDVYNILYLDEETGLMKNVSIDSQSI